MIYQNLDSVIQRLEERIYDNKRELDRTRKQRRTEFTDLYGIPYQAIGDRNNPAKFYISISQDLVYYMRFQFKLHIQPFLSTVSGGTQAAIVDVKPTSLAISNNSITPNPHEHDTEPHTHNLVSGVTVTNTTSKKFTVKVHGVNITPYLMEQHGGAWIDGEGLYPSMDIEDNYDILDVAGLLKAQGYDSLSDNLLKPEFKEISVESDSPFAVTLYLYLKYSNMAR